MAQPDDRKPIKVSPELHHEIDTAATAENRFMYELIEDAWELYKQKKRGLQQSATPKITRPGKTYDERDVPLIDAFLGFYNSEPRDKSNIYYLKFREQLKGTMEEEMRKAKARKKSVDVG